MKVQPMKTSQNAIPIDAALPRRRPLGSYLAEARGLGDADLERIAACQDERALRFGEAAVALGLASEADVLEALAAQFDCPAKLQDVDAELVIAADPSGPQAEAFRELRSRLLLEALSASAPFTLAVVSSHGGDGRTYLAANLAAAFSQLGSRTLLIEADLRAPRLAALLRLQGGAGLSNVLAGLAEAGEALRRVSALRNLWLLPAGALPPNPLELLQRPAFAELLSAMKERFDHVIIDTAAASRGADCRVVAARCEASLVLARRDETRLAALSALVDSLERTTTIAGVVMNER
jgi:chain length determinant protein tyrosine kinase EpsG